jgi:putative PepSY-like beta-lactamase-inhibitor
MTSLLFIPVCAISLAAAAQDLKTKDVPAVVKAAFVKQYPQASKVGWEKEKGNYEANWGGRSGEDHSVQFTPGGQFVEQVDAMAVKDLPSPILSYVKAHFNTTIKEAGKRVDAKGAHTYQVEVKGKDMLFSMEGAFLSQEHE